MADFEKKSEIFSGRGRETRAQQGGPRVPVPRGPFFALAAEGPRRPTLGRRLVGKQRLSGRFDLPQRTQRARRETGEGLRRGLGVGGQPKHLCALLSVGRELRNGPFLE